MLSLRLPRAGATSAVTRPGLISHGIAQAAPRRFFGGRSTHPLHLLRRHNEAVGRSAGLDLVSCGSAATTVCECGVHHPTSLSHAALDLPYRGFATTAPQRGRSHQIHGGHSTGSDDSEHGLPGDSDHSVSQLHGRRGLKHQVVQQEVANFVGGRLVQSLQRAQPPRGSGIQPLLDYNKQWSGEIIRLNPEYFYELAKQQSPQYLWIGCSDSRVPANEIVGLYPGDVFVHRNIANIICNSDLNALAVIQYAIDCLKVEHVIVSGHYRCGGVTAALKEDRIGLADHWILHVGAVKKRHWRRMASDLPTRCHIDALCELNVLAQVEHVVETHLIQQKWTRQNTEDMQAKREGRQSTNKREDEVEIHGWVYGLEDGIIRPLLTLNRRSNVEKEIALATDALFWRYSQL